MSPHQDWLDTYESCFGESVTVDNGASCEVVGISSMRLRLVDGKRLTLTRVRHVPTLGKKLISLEILDDLGLVENYVMGELSVFKDSKLVLRGIKERSLYDFQSVTLLGSVVSASTCL
ncbi:unnamed protein product [Amaranthus hypochondriacus]